MQESYDTVWHESCIKIHQQRWSEVFMKFWADSWLSVHNDGVWQMLAPGGKVAQIAVELLMPAP